MIDEFEALRQDFVTDTLPLVHAIETTLLGIERNLGNGIPADDDFAEVMRDLHTIKGNAGMMGLEAIQGLAHRTEDVVKAMATGQLSLTDDTLDVLLDAVAALTASIEASAPGANLPALDDDVRHRMSSLLERPTAPTPMRPPVDRPLPASSRASAEPIRVEFGKLDHLLNLVGELVIFQTGLGRTFSHLKSELSPETWRDLERQGEALRKTLDELRHAVMQTRLMPISTVFRRFPRMVRDLARSQGKSIELSVEGEDTEIDKTVLDAIADPLLHLLRNSVDHGIEKPAERITAGKAPGGRIVLSASQAGKQIRIDVRDDGRGLDLARIARRAEEIGVDVSGLDPRKIMELIFLPGFSTATEVTEVSGRGVGLSVVRHDVEHLGGHLMLNSVPGRGASVSLLVPLTLAILDALQFRVVGETYAIPLSSVLETSRLQSHRLHRVGDAQVLEWRGQTVPVLDLGARLNLGRAALESAEFAVVVFAAGRPIALPVDRLLGREELVIKGLDPMLGPTPGIAGASILGTGVALLVLDIAELVDR